MPTELVNQHRNSFITYFTGLYLKPKRTFSIGSCFNVTKCTQILPDSKGKALFCTLPEVARIWFPPKGIYN